MANHVRIEELSDSDPEEMDISNFAPPSNSLIEPANIPFQTPAFPAPAPTSHNGSAQDRERTKHWQCLYPVYFDIARTRDQGRRVGRELAVSNPLARDIVDAVQNLGFNVVFEPAKTHPKDWANPGRVRILLKENGTRVARGINNKHHLYIKVAEYLKAHPTTETSPLRLRIAGMPPSSKPPPPPAIPRGWKMGNILPLHSAAISGGGVSDNLFKDVMAEMQGRSVGADSEGAMKQKNPRKKLKS